MQNLPKVYDDKAKVFEIELDKAIQNFLERRDFENYDIQKVDIETNEDIDFIKISHISYDRSKSNTDLNLIDFEQLLSAIASKSKKFVYMIESSSNGIDLYLGTISQDIDFLKDTFNGIYSGSEVETEKESKPQLSNMNYSKAMLGIPALKRDSNKEYKQSLEKILFPLQGKKFRIVLIAESYELQTIQNIISNYQTIGNELHKLAKQSKNLQKSHSNSEGIALTAGNSSSETTGESKTFSNSYGESDKSDSSKLGTTLTTVIGAGIGFFAGGPAGMAIGSGLGGMIGQNFFAKTESENYSKSQTMNSSRTNSLNQSISKNKNITNIDTIGINFEEINKSAQYCEKLIDSYIKRFQKGLNHGMWNTSLYIQAENEIVLSELEHTLKSVYSGDESYFESIRFSKNLNKNIKIDIKKLPMLYFDKDVKHPVHPSFAGFTSVINTEELSILSALPNSDIEGISVSKISSFGLTQSNDIDKKFIKIGNILNKKKPTHQDFKLSLEALNSHLFISGITGSGKSNTIKLILTRIWEEYKIPFLVIEPAKSEYKFLQQYIPELQIFEPGRAKDIFKFNPFIFDYKKDAQYNVLSHIDSIKTAFNAAFPMYGPMPYILEEAIQKAYEDKGWDLETLEHPAFDEEMGLEDEFNRMLFPDMKNLLKTIEYIVDRAGYHNELQNNIKAALITRIKNLTIGAKGFIFNSQQTILNKDLFEKPTIIELSSIVNNEEKSFLMGLILNSLYRYRESFQNSKELKHLLVIEEAHRLLPNISLDQNMETANSKASAIEMFTNILAEIRAFGEGIIISDQIANKLHSDVIKNTNIKIIHRTMAKDDREVVGNSINLNENQILDIAELKTGEAIVHNKDIHQPFLVKIDEFEEKEDFEVSLDSFKEYFLNQNMHYKYDFPFESRYYSPSGKKMINRNKKIISNPKNQYILLQALTQALLGDRDKIIFYWKNFISLMDIEDNIMDNVYLAVKTFLNFELINNIAIYKKPYYFKKLYESVINLFIALNEDRKIDDEIITFQKTLLHKRVKNLYPSMEFYPKNSVDFSILLDEHFKYNYKAKEHMKTLHIASDNKNELVSTLKDISLMVFGKQNRDIFYAILAIRYGKREENLNIILERILNV